MHALKVLLGILLLAILAVLYKLIILPYRLHEQMRRQGINGPSFRPIVGQFPQLKRSQESKEICGIQLEWKRIYGGVTLFMYGPTPRLSITDPNLVRQIFVNNNHSYGKTKLFKKAFPILGNGLIFADGDFWSHQRKLINPTFSLRQIKKQIVIMLESAELIMEGWIEKIKETGNPELEIHQEVLHLALDIIIRASLGQMMDTLDRSAEMGKAFTHYIDATLSPKNKGLHMMIPGYKYLPTESNRERAYWQKQLVEMLHIVIEERKASYKKGFVHVSNDDFLGTLLASKDDKTNQNMTNEQLVNQCFTFLIGGHETTAQLYVWTIILLAQHPEWQKKVREETKQLWPLGVPDMETLSNLKYLHMVLLESLRLFPPIFQMVRECVQDNKVGQYTILRGVDIQVPMYALHTNKDLWGEDALQFNPERFKDGLVGACKHPMGYIPFGVGPRICIGQSFAIVEVKVALGAILRKFSWTLSPNYQPKYAYAVTLRPGGPVPIILKRI